MFFLVFQAGHWTIPLCFSSLLTNFLLTLFSSPPPHYDIFKPQVNDYFKQKSQQTIDGSYFSVHRRFIGIHFLYQTMTGQVRSI